MFDLYEEKVVYASISGAEIGGDCALLAAKISRADAEKLAEDWFIRHEDDEHWRLRLVAAGGSPFDGEYLHPVLSSDERILEVQIDLDEYLF